MYRTNNKKAAIKEMKKYLYTLSQTTFPTVQRTTVDGFYDNETREAVKDFQRIMSLEETGVVDYKTFSSIYSQYLLALEKEKPSKITSSGSFPLSRGDMNEDVRILNVYINELSKIYSGVNYVGTSNYYSDDTATAILSLTKLFMLDETDVTDRALMERIIYDAKNSTLMF